MLLRVVGLVMLAAVVVAAVYVWRSHPASGTTMNALKAAEMQAAAGDQAEWDAGLGALSASDPAAFANLIKQITLSTELALARLGFNPGPIDGTLDPQTQEALRRFEQARRLPVTGDPMSFATMRQILGDTTAMDHEPVLLPAFAFTVDTWEAGSVSARGSWRTPEGKADPPEQATSILCERQSRRCVATTAVLTETASGGHSLSMATAQYEIDVWNDREISTRADRDRVQLRLLRSTHSAVEERVDERGATARRELKDGAADYMEQFRIEQRTRAALVALSPETREWLDRSLR